MFMVLSVVNFIEDMEVSVWVVGLESVWVKMKGDDGFVVGNSMWSVGLENVRWFFGGI